LSVDPSPTPERPGRRVRMVVAAAQLRRGRPADVVAARTGLPLELVLLLAAELRQRSTSTPRERGRGRGRRGWRR